MWLVDFVPMPKFLVCQTYTYTISYSGTHQNSDSSMKYNMNTGYRNSSYLVLLDRFIVSRSNLFGKKKELINHLWV